jgi:SulP family sulfate permease
MAVGIGVGLSLVLQLNREALDLRVARLRMQPDGTITEEPAPDHLESREVTVLDAYGSLLFAGARTLEVRLPDPADAQRPAVVLRLRGRPTLSTTALEVLGRYATRLMSVDGRLYLSGVDEAVAERIRRASPIDVLGSVEIEKATNVLGESSRAAYERARDWIAHGADD